MLDRAVAPHVILRTRRRQCGDFMCRPFACHMLVGSGVDEVSEGCIHLLPASHSSLSHHFVPFHQIRRRSSLSLPRRREKGAFPPALVASFLSLRLIPSWSSACSWERGRGPSSCGWAGVGVSWTLMMSSCNGGGSFMLPYSFFRSICYLPVLI